MIRQIVGQVSRRLLASLGPGRSDASAARGIEGNYRQAGNLARDARGILRHAEGDGRALLCRPVPDRTTLTRARQELDLELRQRFGERGPDEDGWLALMKDRWPASRQYAVIDRHIDEVAETLGRDSDAVRGQMRDELRAALAGRPIAIRVRDNELARILDEGRIRGSRNPTGDRAAAEEQWFGPHVHDNPPVYGYIAVDGVRPSGTGLIDALSELNYGDHQIYLKPEVRSRTTVTVGDSLVDRDRAIPSPVDDPSEYSYGAGMSPGTVGLIDRDYTGAAFRSSMFVEAQMFDITTADIDFIGLHHPPDATLRQALDRSGVQWRVLDNHAIAAEGSPSEQAAAVERTSQDLDSVRDTRRTRPWLTESEDLEAQLSDELRVLREAARAEGGGSAPGTAAAP
ncbi:hypothetical protein [Nocardia sp. NPDC003963]